MLALRLAAPRPVFLKEVVVVEVFVGRVVARSGGRIVALERVQRQGDATDLDRGREVLVPVEQEVVPRRIVDARDSDDVVVTTQSHRAGEERGVASVADADGIPTHDHVGEVLGDILHPEFTRGRVVGHHGHDFLAEVIDDAIAVVVHAVDVRGGVVGIGVDGGVGLVTVVAVVGPVAGFGVVAVDLADVGGRRTVAEAVRIVVPVNQAVVVDVELLAAAERVVDGPITVVVEAIAVDFFQVGVHGGVGVVTVLGPGPLVAIGVEGVDTVAILVGPVVGNLGGVRVDGRAGVVAVELVAHVAGRRLAVHDRHACRLSETIGIGVAVERDVVHDTVVFDSVTVVVETVAQLRGTVVDVGVVVVAVQGPALAIVIVVDHVPVGEAVAVVVHGIPIDFGCVRVHGRVDVVAVVATEHLHGVETVAVGVGHVTVLAVVVDPIVRNVRGQVVDVRVGVVAIAADTGGLVITVHVDVAAGRLGIALTVHVRIEVVDQRIAVVVETVALLVQTGVDALVEVVAVDLLEVEHDRAVLVLVEAARGEVVTVEVAGGTAVALLVHDSVTVVVGHVAGLDGGRVDGGVVVVAVLVGEDAVLVVVHASAFREEIEGATARHEQTESTHQNSELHRTTSLNSPG